jgi:diguanylate cyclase (GGDEF)-like protein
MQRLINPIRSGNRPTELDDSLQVELVRLHFQGFAPTVALGVIGLISASYLLAYWYRDPLMWRIAHLAAVVGMLRLGFVLAAVVRLQGEFTSREAHTWQSIYSLTTFTFCVTLAASTLYNFAVHDETGRLLATIGTFSICSGISGRIGLKPLTTQICGCLMLATLAYSLLRYEQTVVRFGALACCAFGYAYCESVQTKFQLLVEQIQNRRSLRLLAESDALTGLANRRHFQQRLEDAVANDVNFGVLLIDLDHFKAVNDTHGHHIGDALLQLAASRLSNLLRDSALVARLGGDEFAILVSPLPTGLAPALARRVTDTLADPFQIDGLRICIGASIGIQVSTPEHRDTKDILIQADAALYQAKAAGRGGFAFAA